VPGIRPFGVAAPANIKVVASKAGWWTMSKTVLAKYCKELGAAPDDAASLFSTLLALIGTCMPLAGDDAVMGYIRTRLGNEQDQLSYADELFEIDEAVGFLDQHDKKLVTQEKNSVRIKESSYNDLRKSFTERAQALREQAAGAVLVRGKAKKKKESAADARPPFNFSISHREAKRHIPPGCSIWRGFTQHRWCGHCPPNKRISNPFGAGADEGEAMFSCIRRLWVEHLELHGLDKSACPYAGLL